MTYKLTELIDTKRLQLLLDYLYDAAGIPSRIIGADSEVITATGWRDVCTEFHRVNDINGKRCHKSDGNIQTDINSGERYVIRKYTNGMLDIASPIIIDNNHIATIFQGQFFFEKPDLSYLRSHAKEVGIDEESYLKAICDTPVISEEDIKPVVSFLTELADFISELGYSKLQIEQHSFELNTKHEELTAVYEELVAQEEELRSNYQLISDKSQALEISNEKLLKAKEAYELITEGSFDATWDIDLINETTHYSSGIESITGVPYSSDHKHSQIFNLLHPDDRKRVEKTYFDALENKSIYIDKYRIINNFGQLKWVMVKGKIKRHNNKAVRVAGSIGDITYQVKAEASIKDMAYTDSLTKTFNRNQMYHDLNAGLETVQSATDNNLIVMFLDIDNFKTINDIYGHTTGDSILIQVADRLKQHNDAGSELYRFGGDEFVIVCNKSITCSFELAESILHDFRLPFLYLSIEHTLTASIGIASYPSDGLTVETLIKNADMAMYDAKEKGKNQYRKFDISMHESLIEKKHLDELLVVALKNKEFFLTYQPLVDIESNKVNGLEALIRWNRNNEIITPNQFIPQAEHSGFIKNIDLFVLETVIQQIMSWLERDIQFDYVSVNLSPAFFMDDQLMSILENLIKTYAFNPRDIQIEITENILIKSFDQAYSIITRLKVLGFTIALDDFGQGYSSLSYLKSLPIDVLKIDKYFIDNLVDESEPIIEFIIGMGQRLKMTVVAEGVETVEQLNHLKSFNCDKYQGYLFSKPVTVGEAEKILLKP